MHDNLHRAFDPSLVALQVEPWCTASSQASQSILTPIFGNIPAQIEDLLGCPTVTDIPPFQQPVQNALHGDSSPLQQTPPPSATLTLLQSPYHNFAEFKRIIAAVPWMRRNGTVDNLRAFRGEHLSWFPAKRQIRNSGDSKRRARRATQDQNWKTNLTKACRYLHDEAPASIEDQVALTASGLCQGRLRFERCYNWTRYPAHPKVVLALEALAFNTMIVQCDPNLD
ncbi:hypothetical protein PG989_000502 [Apiospora arundinis]